MYQRFTNSKAKARNNSPMEADTIQKTREIPKNHKSRGNFFKGITKGLFVFTVTMLSVASAFAQQYHSADKEGLRAFLRQPSAEAGKINAQQLGLTISDTTNWQSSEAWVSNVLNLTWNNESPKRLIRISDGYPYGWSYGKKLAGTLDASKWTELTNLNFWFNEITELNVSANTKLTDLRCNQNSLSELDVSACTALTYLDCNNNKLTELDVSAKTALTYLSCYNNLLTNLNINGCIALTKLECFYNQLNALNINSNGNLKYLSCYSNQLNSLNVTANTILEFLDCGSNQITNFDFSKNTELNDLRCHTNKLTTLDVSANTKLTRLECQNNQLIELHIPPAITSLWVMYCEENHLLLSDLFTISEILNNCGPTPVNNRRLSRQTWAKQTVGIDTELDFTPPQNVFNGEYTYFTVTKNGEPAIEGDDYSVVDGKITFHNLGNYIVTMKNDAIISNDDKLVIMEIEVLCEFTWQVGKDYPTDDVVATLDYCNGTLTICGTGAMQDWEPYWINNNNTAPWYISGLKDEIKDIVICKGVTTIGNAAFLDCHNITSIVIPDGITKIGDHAFQSCYKLTEIHIPNSVIYIGKESFAWPYAEPFGLMDIHVHWQYPITGVFSNAFAGLPDVKTVNLYVPSCTQHLYAAAPVWKEFHIIGPSGEWKIGKDIPDNIIATYNNRTLTISGTGEMKNWIYNNTTLPWFCIIDDITCVIIESGVTTIGNYAFLGCPSLTSVTIPNSITAIGEGSFFLCGNLPSIIIPSSVTTIGNKAFSYCGSLTSITSLATVPPATDLGFDFTSDNFPIYVPCNYKSAYQASPGWAKFNIIVEFKDMGVFGEKCDNLTWHLSCNGSTLTISGNGGIPDFNAPEETPWYNYKETITTLIIQKGITSIGAYAFYGLCNLGLFISYAIPPPPMQPNTFGGCGKSLPNCKVLVDCRYLDVYKETPYWSEFLNYDCFEVVGIEDITLSQIKIYPNPTNKVLMIDSGKLTMDNAEYTIFSITGQLIMQGKLSGETTTINAESLTSGMYFLRIGEKTVKFVKE